jgi:hypothetical protein
MMARSAGLEELVSVQHPGTSMAPTMAASTNPRLRGLDNMNPRFARRVCGRPPGLPAALVGGE